MQEEVRWAGGRGNPAGSIRCSSSATARDVRMLVGRLRGQRAFSTADASLHGCIAADLAVPPFTNSLLIQRSGCAWIKPLS